jgi:hypothetical protein
MSAESSMTEVEHGGTTGRHGPTGDANVSPQLAQGKSSTSFPVGGRRCDLEPNLLNAH